MRREWTDEGVFAAELEAPKPLKEHSPAAGDGSVESLCCSVSGWTENREGPRMGLCNQHRSLKICPGLNAVDPET